MLAVCALLCSAAVSHAQPNFHSAMPVAGDRGATFQWTIGELFTGYRTDATGASLTAGFNQPVVAMATDLRTQIDHAEISAFPIPARDYLNLQFDRNADWTLFLMDVRGRSLASWQLHAKQTKIPLTDLRPGVYVLRVLDTDRRSQIIRFVKH